MTRSNRNSICAFAGFLLLFWGTVSNLVALPVLDVGMVLLGDKKASARYSLRGPDAGSLTQLLQAGLSESLAGPVYPWLAEGDRLSSPSGHWDDGSSMQGSAAVLGMRDGAEEAKLVMDSGLGMQTRLISAGQGVWLWELVVTNQSKKLLTCQAGLAIETPLTNHDTIWQANDGMAVLRGSSGVCVIGAVSAEGVSWMPPGKGLLHENGPETVRGLGSLHGNLRLAPSAGGRILFVMAVDKSLDRAKRECLEWMRYDGLGRAISRAKANWDSWLAEGRMPFFTDRALQVSMLRSLRTLVLADQHPGIAPLDVTSILDCAEAMRGFWRDRETAAWLALIPAAIGRSARNTPILLAMYPDGRDVLMRYASLVSRQTIASGRLAGNLDLVDAGLKAVSQSVTASNAHILPVDAVQLEAALHDGALLMQLARRNPVSQRMLTNAAQARVLADNLWSSEARVWTNASGLPDARVIADAGLQASGDMRYDLQYRRLRAFNATLSERDKALVLVAAARAFDLDWYQRAADQWVESSARLPEIARMALWMRIISEGSLAGYLEEEIACSGFRLETLYRVILEMRHASTRVASSFVFRDLRSRIRQHLERVEGRDTAFVSGLGVSLGELRTELVKYGLTSELEKRQVLSRLNRVDRMIAGMLQAGSSLALDTGVIVDSDLVTLASGAARLELPDGWSLGNKTDAKDSIQYKLHRPSLAPTQAQEGRVLVAVRCGTRTIQIAGAYVLYNPQPLAMHLVPETLRSARLVVENRGGQSALIRVVQSSPKILTGDIPQKIAPHSVAVIGLDATAQAGRARMMLLAKQAGREIRLEKTVLLSERLEPDTRWLHVQPDKSVQVSLDTSAATRLAPDADGLIRIKKTLAGILHSGAMSFGIQGASASWELRADDILIQPVRDGDWLWYDLDAHGSSVISVTFSDQKFVPLFARAAKQLVVGVSER